MAGKLLDYRRLARWLGNSARNLETGHAPSARRGRRASRAAAGGRAPRHFKEEQER
jgi:hypothetical protein